MRNIICQLVQKPKNLFLIDGTGAFVTAFLLYAVLRTFHKHIGLPETTLMLLAVFAAVFCIYSFSCFFLVNKNLRSFLLAISIANMLYCCVTLALIVYHYPAVTIWGIVYFTMEIAVVCALVLIELKAWRTG